MSKEIFQFQLLLILSYDPEKAAKDLDLRSWWFLRTQRWYSLSTLESNQKIVVVVSFSVCNVAPCEAKQNVQGGFSKDCEVEHKTRGNLCEHHRPVECGGPACVQIWPLAGVNPKSEWLYVIFKIFSRYPWSSKLETTLYWRKHYELGPNAPAFSSQCSSPSWLALTVSLPRYLSGRLLVLKTLKRGCVKWRRNKSKTRGENPWNWAKTSRPSRVSEGVEKVRKFNI